MQNVILKNVIVYFSIATKTKVTVFGDENITIQFLSPCPLA